jgi:hypothetical protein
MNENPAIEVDPDLVDLAGWDEERDELLFLGELDEDQLQDDEATRVVVRMNNDMVVWGQGRPRDNIGGRQYKNMIKGYKRLYQNELSDDTFKAKLVDILIDEFNGRFLKRVGKNTFVLAEDNEIEEKIHRDLRARARVHVRAVPVNATVNGNGNQAP